MNFFYCWPYEELTVTKLEETRAFRFALPWYASVIQTGAEGATLFEKLFVDETPLPQEEILEAYRLALSPTIHEPFAYILPFTYDNHSESRDAQALPSPHIFLNPKSLADKFGFKDAWTLQEWTWDIDTVLTMSQIAGTDSYSLVSLYSVFRRFFYLEAQSKDKTKNLYQDLPSICKSPEAMTNALAYIITQNLHVTQRCEAALSAAMSLAGNNEENLREFAGAERGHDKIMQKALEVFPSLSAWSQQTHPSTALLMNLFEEIGRNNFLAFAFAICLFERPQLEEVHPVTQMLQNYGLHEAARRYEVHHKINEAGDHDHIGFAMIQKMPLLSREEALQATRWAEAISWVMTEHSANLLNTISEAST